jgi:hypothetical protein
MARCPSPPTPWPQGLRTIFDICRQQREPLEYRYYGPYDKLLNYCFGDSFRYFVAPQSPPSDLTLRDTVNFVLVVFDAHRRPVLITEIKDDAWAHIVIVRMTRFAVDMTQCLVTVLFLACGA